MEHPCYKCNSPVEDGTPFCPHCSAPQIRVAGRETNPSIEAAPVIFDVGRAETALPGSIDWSHAVPSAAIAGFISAMLMLIPLGALGLGMLSGGALAVYLYRRRTPFLSPTASLGARLGALAGIMGFSFFGIFTAIEVLVFHTGDELRRALIQAIEQSAARNSDPQAQVVVEYMKSPPGLTLVMVLGLFFMLVAFLVLSSLGGALGAALMRRKPRI